MRNLYTDESRQKVLTEFREKIGEPFSPAKMRDNNAVQLFTKLTGKVLTISGIINFLEKSKDPVAFKSKQNRYKSNQKNPSVLGEGNALFNMIGDFKMILVPSHGDCAGFDTEDEVKKAIENFKSPNISYIGFKLLKVVPIKVQAVVNCAIG